jgi:hypothetical protein|nr:MAG TPA: hypothetical protein [Caudoviricetes sp.]
MAKVTIGMDCLKELIKGEQSPQAIDVVGEGLITVKKETLNNDGVTFTVATSPSLQEKLDSLTAREDSDKQTLTIDGNKLSISNGNEVDLPQYDDKAVKDAINHLGDGLTQAMDYTEQVKNYVDSKADALTLVLGTSKADSDAKNNALTTRVNVLEEAKPVVENKLTEIEAKNTAQDEKITALENRTDNFINNVTVSKEAGKVKLTYSRVDGSSSEVEFEDSDTITLAYDDEPLKTRIKALENKEDKDTIYNDTEVKQSIKANESAIQGVENDLTSFRTHTDARIEALENKEDNDKQTLNLTDHTLSISNGNSVELPKYDDSELKAKDAEQDVAIKTLKDKTKSFLTGAGVTRQGDVVTLTYTNIDGTSTNLEFNDHDTKAIAYDDTALKARVQELENKTDNDTVYDDAEVKKLIQANKDRIATVENKVDEHENSIASLTLDVGALKIKEDKDTVYNDSELRSKITALEGKTDNFVSSVGVSREGNTVKLTYTMVNGDNKEVEFTDNDTVSVAYDDSALRGRVEALENKPEVEYELAKTTKAVTLSQGEGVINLESEATTDPLKELVLTGNVSAKVKSPFGGDEDTVAGKFGFNSGTTGDELQGSHRNSINEFVYVEFFYTGNTMRAYLVYEPENFTEVVKYRKELSLAELQGTDTARIAISKNDVEQGYVEATFTGLNPNINSYKVQKKG